VGSTDTVGAVSASPDRSRRRALFTFAAIGLLASVVVLAVALVACRQVGIQEAITSARDKTTILANAVVAPGMPRGLVTGDPAAIAAMQKLANDQLLGPDVARVKIWAEDGTIVFSDDARLIGTRYPLGEEELEVLREGGIEAEVSDLSRPENRFEVGGGDLLEVYTPVTSPEGKPLLFEAYYRYEAVNAAAAQLSNQFVPIVVGGVLLLALLQLPLAWRLSTRIQRDQVAKQRLLEAAVEASDVERKRIAADLHDGVVQDLTGVTFTLAAMTNSFEPGDARAESVETAAAHTRNAVTALRSLLVEIYPPNLRDAGIESALGGLLAALEARGISTSLEVQLSSPLPEAVETVIFRCAQEGLRNVVRHANANSVDVRLIADNAVVTLQVTDDGVGFDSSVEAAVSGGHFGLAVLGDAVAHVGGTWAISSVESGGTTLRVEVPLT